MSYTIKHNTPQAGCIQWAGLSIQYEGQTHAITDGYTNSIYAYWTPKFPNNLVVTNEYPTLTTDDCLVFLNKSGTALVVPGATGLDGGLIVPGTILADALAANSVTADAIAAGAVTANAIAANSISSNLIAANAIGTAALAAGAVTADKIVSEAITTDKIAASAVTATEIAANAITATKIKSGEVTSDKIASNAITASKISADAITSEKIATNAIKSKNYKVGVSGSFLNLEDGSFDSKNFWFEKDGSTHITGSISATEMAANKTYKIYDEDIKTPIGIIGTDYWKGINDNERYLHIGLGIEDIENTQGNTPYIKFIKSDGEDRDDEMYIYAKRIGLIAKERGISINGDVVSSDKISAGEFKENKVALADKYAAKTHFHTNYAACTTAANTAAKIVAIPDLKTLVTGTVITIRFGYTINTANSTLNVSSTGAKPIYYNNKPLSIGAIQADDIVSFVYYSSRWQVIGSLNQAGVATDYFGSLDFNKYTVAGRYIIHRSGNETMLNGPGSNLTGWLDVMVNQDVITQIMTDFNGRLINIRGFYQSWGKWVTYSGAGSPTVGSALNFKSGTAGISRNLSTQQIIGNRCFADISFQTNAAITAYTRMFFTGYYTPITDNDTRLLVYDTGIQFQVSCSVYNDAFYIIPTLNISPGWHRFQFSYQTTGTIHA